MYKTNKLQGANAGNSDGERIQPMENDDPSLNFGGGGGGGGEGLGAIAPLPPIHPVAPPTGVAHPFLPNETMPSVDAMNSDPQLAANTAFGNQGGRASGNFTRANGLQGIKAGNNVY
jgi:hypothetical protein